MRFAKRVICPSERGHTRRGMNIPVCKSDVASEAEQPTVHENRHRIHFGVQVLPFACAGYELLRYLL